ncbi:AraC family transcriptional regulator [Gracilibacillus massiliensis]|uniref:AraC family transcriptional regulator n=1 Tax=Gracilibacillus massiliensis TaxID=1564956 RepID=UPI00071D7B83|nr:AraC family transcriptional regulator [Gracilibacillus massiliensis]
MVQNLQMLKKRVDVPEFTIQHKNDNKTIRDFHAHPGYEIVWVRNGEAKFIFEEKVYHVRKDDVLFFRSSDFHRVRLLEEAPYDRVMIMFTDAFYSFEQPIFTAFKQLLDHSTVPHRLLHLKRQWHEETFHHIIHQLLKEDMNQHKWQQKNALSLYLTELLLFLGREVHTTYDHSSAITGNSNEIRLQEKILREINLIWDTSWQLNELADKLHFNKYYLCHFFKKEFGLTIHQYILERRMYEAKKLLVETTIPVTEIAANVGFSTSSNFIRCFKQQLQITPKQYREEKRRE